MSTKVAVLGGGCGAMTAAFYLTSTPELRARFDVTVYQQGWRLGGKGASGRNAAHGQRIEEHGLHMWMGFYENAFRTIRACYAEWEKQPQNPFQDWTDAFAPQYLVSLMERVVKDGKHVWEPWNLLLPPHPGTPGSDAFSLMGVASYVKSLEEWVAASIKQVGKELLTDGFKDLPDTLRRLKMMVQIGVAMIKGLITDVLPYGEEGFRRIDAYDLREWLVMHGAPAQVVADAAPLRAIYDLAFAYVGGDTSDPKAAQMAAGAGANLLLKMVLAYKGAPLWRMRAGMGDTVFSPFYEVLRQRGARFEFFHRVENLRLSPDGNQIAAILISQQARVKDGGAYQPLVEVKGLPCWPSEPFWDQLEGGGALKARGTNFESMWCQVEAGKKTLELGRDFDLVVLGISLAGLKDCCRELIARKPSWHDMVEKIPTTMTQAMQLWLAPDLAGLGWDAGPTVMTGYAEPFDSWGEMSEVLPREDWPAHGAPKSVEYFCAAMKEPAVIPPYADPEFPERERRAVEARGNNFLDEEIATIWPKAAAPGTPGLDRRLLTSSYFRANIDPSERYVLSPPGSIKYRKRSNESEVQNLFLAGDWLATSINGGSVEAAVEGGMQAAQAICGIPETIHGDDGGHGP